MWCAIAYQLWLSDWWVEQASYRSDASSELLEGLVAYAKRQSYEEHKLAQCWILKFKPLRLEAEKFLANMHLSSICALKNYAFSASIVTASTPKAPARPTLNIQAPLRLSDYDVVVELAINDPVVETFMDDFD